MKRKGFNENEKENAVPGLSVGIEGKPAVSTIGGAGVIYAQAGCDMCPLGEWKKATVETPLTEYEDIHNLDEKTQERTRDETANPEERIELAENNEGQRGASLQVGSELDSGGAHERPEISEFKQHKQHKFREFTQRIVNKKWFKIMCCINLDEKKMKDERSELSDTEDKLKSDKQQMKESSPFVDRLLNVNAYLVLIVLVILYFYMK